MPSIPAASRSRVRNLVGFSVGEVFYAVDIQRVREIIRPLPMQALPQTPPSVLGVADHRGEVVPVVDLRLRFGLPAAPASRQQRWVIVTSEGRLTALVVDRVVEVFGGEAPDARGVPTVGAGDEARGIVGAYSYRDGLAFVVDPDVLVSASMEIDIEKARTWVLAGGGHDA